MAHLQPPRGLWTAMKWQSLCAGTLTLGAGVVSSLHMFQVLCRRYAVQVIEQRRPNGASAALPAPAVQVDVLAGMKARLQICQPGCQPGHE